MEKIYNPNLFEAEVHLKLLVTASNEEHAEKRIEELLKSRITQYVHPDDTPPQFKVIALVEDFFGIKDVRRKRIVERHTQ